MRRFQPHNTALEFGLALLLTGCPPPKERPADGGAGGGLERRDVRPTDQRPPRDRGPDLDRGGPLDLDAAVEAGREVGPEGGVLSDLGPGCDSGRLSDAASACAGCWIGANCVGTGVADTSDSTGCRVCDPTFNRLVWAPKKGCVITLAGSGSKGLAALHPAHRGGRPAGLLGHLRGVGRGAGVGLGLPAPGVLAVELRPVRLLQPPVGSVAGRSPSPLRRRAPAGQR